MYNIKEKSMKKTFLVLAMVLISFLSNAQRIAVLDFNAGVGVSQADVDGISAIFNTYFSPKGYTLVERTQIDKAIDEQNFQRGRFTESQMVKIGQILNVSNVVIGDINIVANQYNVDVRVINVQSGTIQATEGATWAAGSSFRNMMNSLATKLADKIAINPMALRTTNGNHTASPHKRTSVEIIYGYLKVFPEEIGSFENIPNTIINQLNNQAAHGYNTWRIPTNEELSLLKANGYLSNAIYMTKESPNGIVLLVTDKADAETIKSEQEKIAEEKRIAEEKKKKEAEEKRIKAEQERLKKEEEERLKAEQYARTHGSINGHEYVDLGLSVKWATCNIGAESPKEYGSYFAWGSRLSRSADDYNKPCEKTYKQDIYDISGSSQYDSAKSYWGSSWRMPTKSEIEELINKCTWKWNGNGYNITGPNGNSIFIPAAGCSSSYPPTLNNCGYYWTSTPNVYDTREAYSLIFGDSFKKIKSDADRGWGYRVRPVSN